MEQSPGGVGIAAGIISAALIGGLIYALIRHTKLFLLILLGLVLLTAGIVIALACYEKYGRGFQTVGEKNLQKRLVELTIRIRRSRRFSRSNQDTMINGYCDQLMEIAGSLSKMIKDTPDSPQKQELVTQKLDELEHAVGELEHLNLTVAATASGQLPALEDDLRLVTDAIEEARAAVYGTEPVSAAQTPEADSTEQFYSAEQ